MVRISLRRLFGTAATNTAITAEQQRLHAKYRLYIKPTERTATLVAFGDMPEQGGYGRDNELNRLIIGAN